MYRTLIFSCLVTFCLINGSSSIRLPQYIKPCKIDATLDDCALKSGRIAIPKLVNGDRKYKIPKLDPFQVKSFIMDHGSKQIGLKLEMFNSLLIGLKHIKFTASRMDMKKRHIEWDLIVPKLEVFGEYKVDGKIFVLPIAGNGNGSMTLINLNATFIVDFDKEKRNGKDYIKIMSNRIKFDCSRLYFKLDHLLNRNKLLGDNLNQFLDENWREVLNELEDSIATPISEISTAILKGIVNDIPFDEVFLK
ncbi:protein takeout-like [Nilaparvata lugens]|uniref:protein takeout-like n=1 Tax=Nilaparvata lugens TaxID=108931 RepID=UPI00193D2DB1|nr:protein takeout-like [Nilaparvata lugens]